MDHLLICWRRQQTRATFFGAGEVAVAHPRLMQTLVAEHHEVACHGNGMRMSAVIYGIHRTPTAAIVVADHRLRWIVDR